MPRPRLYSVPDDPHTPYPVDMARVRGSLYEIGYEPGEASFTETRGEAVIGGRPYVFSFFSGGDYLSVRTAWNPPPSTSIPHLFATANSWNRTRFFPTVYVDGDDGDNVEVVADMVSHCRYGLSPAQLKDEVENAVSTCGEAIGYVQWTLDKAQLGQ